MTKVKHTKTVDGYRWETTDGSNYSGIITAHPQQRRTTDSGRVYFAYCLPKAQFDTIADRDRFIEAFPARQWAVRSGSITI